MLRTLCVLIAAAVLTGQSAASFLLQLDEPFRTAEHGDFLTYTGTLTYTGEENAAIGIGFYAPSGFARDWQSELGIGEMSPGSTYTGELFSFRIDDRAEFQIHDMWIYASAFLPDNTMYSDVQQLQVQVVPEPATLLGLLCPALVLLRRKRRVLP